MYTNRLIIILTTAVGSPVVLFLLLIFVCFVFSIRKSKLTTTSSTVMIPKETEAPKGLTLSEDINNSMYASCPTSGVHMLSLPHNEQDIYQSLELKKIPPPLSYSQEYNHLFRPEKLKN